ncbi:DgyrCDS12383 [Dimorphilus gyrociliatus]|uniref:DgyrCDS12383 n=1 Tax=Dimorphilus gyrociliatus TaxID=2664684 RepID=A0A7I8W741_9ANNE|nr:DgyrCDS12383 [Dimorphilus gyrociliatus]
MEDDQLKDAEQDIQITKQLLKSKSGEFDIESIHHISLTHYGIEDLGCIGECSALQKLDLSFNDITKLFSLSSLINLQYLNISANRISSLEGLQSLDNLCYLNASGNLINSIQSLRCLSYLEKLKELRLIDKMNELTNPVCLNNSYSSDVKEILPSLTALDGERIKGKGSEVFDLFRDVESLLEERERLRCNMTGLCLEENGPWLPEIEENMQLIPSHSLLFDAEEDLESLLKQCRVVCDKASSRINEVYGLNSD